MKSADREPGVEIDGNTVEVAAFSPADVIAIVNAAMEATHAHNAGREPWCCYSGFALLLTAAEAALLGPVNSGMGPKIEAQFRAQAKNLGRLCFEMHNRARQGRGH